MSKFLKRLLIGLIVVVAAFSHLTKAYYFDPESRVFSDECPSSRCYFQVGEEKPPIYATTNLDGESSFSVEIPDGVTSILYLRGDLDNGSKIETIIDLTEFVVPDPEPQPEPQSTFEEETYTRDIPFETEYEDDPTLEIGQQQIKREGEVGKEQVSVIRELRDGVVIDERVTNLELITEPVTQIVLRGTKEPDSKVELELTRLTISGGTMSPEFNNQILEYQVVLDEGVTEIEFDADFDDSLTVSGLGRVDVNLGKHEITLKNDDGQTKIFKFNWTSTKVFKFEGKNLTYDGSLENSHKSFSESELLVDGNKYVVYIDEHGNTIVPLKDETGKSQFYLYSKEKGVFAKFDPIEIDGVLYNRTVLDLINDDLLKQYGLEKVSLSDLNIDGYKINKDSHKGKFIIVLMTLQGKNGIYEYNQDTKKITLIRESDKISPEILKNYFSNVTDKSTESKVDWIMVGLLGVLLVVLIVLVVVILRGMKRDRETMMKLREAQRNNESEEKLND